LKTREARVAFINFAPFGVFLSPVERDPARRYFAVQLVFPVTHQGFHARTSTAKLAERPCFI
jgi:hypothetical protein